jgi:hypothetical protein
MRKADDGISRREFLGKVGTAAAASVALTPLTRSVLNAQGPPAAAGMASAPGGDLKLSPGARVLLKPFDYSGVKLRPSRWQKQAAEGRDFYMALPDDDVLKGYRQAAGLAAPGRTLGGWCERNSDTVFGQWLQAMARMQRANGDTEMLEKAGLWVSEWAKAWRPPAAAAAGFGHYPYEKLVGGLLDMHHYGGHPQALAMCGKITEAARAGLKRDRVPASREPWELHSGHPGEWYTLGENLYRAYQLTGQAGYREFADVWLYPSYWNKFAETSDPRDAHGVHAYSHCNSFASCALAYDVTGDRKYLTILKNFYDWMQKRQTYATGGYGPDERLVMSDGALGSSLEEISASFECPCCSWAAFKVSKSLMMFTGEARFGDWIERLLYNGIGAALPIVPRGKHFYYADYHLGADLKYYSRNDFTCCSGTYFQNIAEYSNLLYFRDDRALYVNLYVPSDVEWRGPAGPLRLAQTTSYPEADTSTLRLSLEKPARFALKLRVPGWCEGWAVRVNGRAADAAARPGAWATLEREWQSGDSVEVTLPLRFRRAPIDGEHPDRFALMRGPVVYAQEDPHKWLSSIPKAEEDLNKLMRAVDDDPAVFQIANEPVAQQRNAFKPYYRFVELERHRIYFDAQQRRVLW